MTKRKFTPPTEFPAEYVDRDGNKAVILGRAPNKVFPFIGHDADGCARDWTKKGKYLTEGKSTLDLQDIPEVTAELEQAEARIEALEGKLARALDVLLEAVEPSQVDMTAAEAKKYQDAWLEVEIVELEAKLAKAVETEREACANVVKRFYEKGQVTNPDDIMSRPALAAQKGQDDE